MPDNALQRKRLVELLGRIEAELEGIAQQAKQSAAGQCPTGYATVWHEDVREAASLLWSMGSPAAAQRLDRTCAALVHHKIAVMLSEFARGKRKHYRTAMREVFGSFPTTPRRGAWGDEILADHWIALLGRAAEAADYVRELRVSLSAGKGKRRRPNANYAVIQKAVRDKVLAYDRDHHQDLSLRDLETGLKAEGCEVDHVTIGRILKDAGRRRPGNPHRAAKGKAEREAVAPADDLADVGAYTMPDDR